MPLFDFRCNQCGLEFQVSRPEARAGEAALCPMDNTACERIAITNGGFVRQGDRRDDDMPKASQGGAAFSHFGHSHGPGAGSHSHGPFG